MHPTFEIFGLTLPAFGIMMMLGLVSAFVLMYFLRRHIAITEDDFLSAAIWAILCGMLGSKLLYWIVELDQVIADPSFLIRTLTAGFVFYGAVFGGILGISIFCLRKKQPILQYVDLFAPAIVIGQAFGRIGCFLAGCCYGAPSDCSLAVCYPAGVGSAAPAGVPLLPTQLFESAFCFVLAFALCAIFRRQKRLGTTTGCYFILYGIWRFLIEFFRSDDRGAVGGLSTSQFIGIFIVLAGLVLLWLVKKEKTPLHPCQLTKAEESAHSDEAAKPLKTTGITEESASQKDASEETEPSEPEKK